jgi:hypothetical protein
MRDAQSEAAAELLQDRFELLRLRTLLVGSLGIVVLIFSLVALFGYGSRALSLLGQAISMGTDEFHVPNNLFQKPADTSWSRTPFLLQIAFVVIGISGISYMTRQVLSTLQIRVWLAVLFGLAVCIIYMQSNVGSVWNSSQRDLVKAVRAKEWTLVEQLSSGSQNQVGHNYVMAQIGLVKPDDKLLQLHGKTLVDKLDDMLMRRGSHIEAFDSGLLSVADEFKPKVLGAIDMAIYGSAHTQIGLSLAQSATMQENNSGSWGWALTKTIFEMLIALVGIVIALLLLRLWRLMTRRLRWLRPWVAAAY